MNIYKLIDYNDYYQPQFIVTIINTSSLQWLWSTMAANDGYIQWSSMIIADCLKHQPKAVIYSTDIDRLGCVCTEFYGGEPRCSQRARGSMSVFQTARVEEIAPGFGSSHLSQGSPPGKGAIAIPAATPKNQLLDPGATENWRHLECNSARWSQCSSLQWRHK